MILLYGCSADLLQDQNKHSDYNLSSGLSSFSLDSLSILSVYGDLVDSADSKDQTKYQFQVCSMQDADRCRNPFVASSGLELSFDRDHIASLLDGFDRRFPDVIYVMTKNDGRTRIIDHLSLESNKNVESVSVIKSKEYSLSGFKGSLVSSKLLSIGASEDAGKDLYKINTGQLEKIATFLNRYSKKLMNQEQIAYVCSSGHLNPKSCVSLLD